jgi:hypothetical protein
VTSQSVPITIVNDGQPGKSDVAIPLSLSSPGSGAALGSTSTATLVIHDNNPPFVVVTSPGFGTIKLGAGKKAKRTTGIVVPFNGALNPTQANNLAAFHLLSGKVKKGHTTYTKNVPLKSAIYNALAHTISLVPKSKLNTSQPEQLTITSSLLTDWLGRPIDGNHDGQPGGDFVATLKGKTVTIASRGVAKAASAAASQHAVDAIDRALAGSTGLVTRPVRPFHTVRKPHGLAQEGQVVIVVLPNPVGPARKSAWLRRVFTMANRLPHEVDVAAPQRNVRP